MTTPKLGLPTITGNMTADVVRDINTLAEAIDDSVASLEDVAAIAGTSNADVTQIKAVLLESDTRQTVFEYTGGVITAIVEKDGATEVTRTTLNYTAGALTSVAEAAGGKTVTSTLNRDGGGNLVDITKGVA